MTSSPFGKKKRFLHFKNDQQLNIKSNGGLDLNDEHWPQCYTV